MILAMNKESMLTDPIDWNVFKDRLTRWSEDWPAGLLSISSQTDLLFSERSPLLHPPRALSKHPINVLLQSCSTIHFFDAHSPKKPHRPTSIPKRAADLIGQMNRHPHFLGLLGILPNQLRTLLKETGHEYREEALLDLSHTLFLAGYRVWEKRQQFAHRYWKNIKQPQLNGIVKKKKRKRNNKDEKISESKCRNPFHYTRRYDNLSNQRPTKCPCRNVTHIQKVYKDQPITEFAFKFPIKNVSNGSNLSAPRKMFPRKKRTIPTHDTLFKTRTEDIRKQHDRGRKRPYKQLTLNLTSSKKMRI